MSKLSGLYGITDPEILPDTHRLLEAVEQALAGGMRMLQYRAKSISFAQRRTEARLLRQLCHDNQALFIINDDLQLALECDADGVHVGREDESIGRARELLGPEAVIGCSCYNRLENALEAQAQGADYVAFGRFFASQTKPQAVQADPDLLAEAHGKLEIPICAIGGVTVDNAPILIEQGVDMLAVIRGLFAARDIQATAQAMSRLFDR